MTSDEDLRYIYSTNFMLTRSFLWTAYHLIINVQVLGIKLSEDEMYILLNEIDLNYNGQMELQDYLQVNHRTSI